MISIDVNSLNDLAEVEKAIEKLSFVRDALKKAEDARGHAFREVWDKTFGPTETTIKTRPLRGAFDLGAYASRVFAESGRRFNGLTPYQEKVVTRLDELTPEDLDEMNAGPAIRIEPYAPPFMDPQEAIQDDGIVCLIDGEKRKFLARYVRQVHGLEWYHYLARYDLPSDYPRTCRDVIKQRTELAIERGLGKTRPDEDDQQVQVTVPIRKTFGRRAAPQQVSVQVDIGRSVNTTPERRKERRLTGLL